MRLRLRSPCPSSIICRSPVSFAPPPSLLLSSRLSPVPLQLQLQLQLQLPLRASASDDLGVGRRIDLEQIQSPQGPQLELQLELGGPDGGGHGSGNGNGNGNGGAGGGGDGDGDGDGDEEEKNKSGMGMLMSQKFTLAYAVLVGVGGLMGFLKKGSIKSAAAGAASSLLLFYVYTQLPTNPTFASSLGLGISAALLAVMGSRFKKSGKIFPAGVVSLVSLFMTGGYLHAILRH